MEDHTDQNVTSVNPFLYRGYYYDKETGLYYLNSRYYDSVVGRFINSDAPEILDINNIEELYVALCIGGPLYGSYHSFKVAHMIVVTGVDLRRKRVYTNNPWGIKGQQSFLTFRNIVAGDSYQSSKKSKFGCIYLVKR